MAGQFPILYIAPTAIGDAVLASGLIKRLFDEIPGAGFTLVVSAETEPLYRDAPSVDELIVWEGETRLSKFGLWRRLSGTGWGLVLDARGVGIVGYLRRRKRAELQRPSPDAPVVHAIVEYARILRLEDAPPPPFIFTSEETEAKADEFLGSGGPILAVGPGSSWIGRTWPPERFNEVAARLLGKGGPMAGGRLLILGGERERDAARTIRFATSKDRVIDATGKLDLLDSYACLKRVRMFIGAESGLMHLAGAAGAPVVGLFGPSDERRRGPWGENTVAVRGPRSFEDFLAVDPNLNQALNHMIDLQVDTVLESAVRLHAATEKARA